MIFETSIVAEQQKQALTERKIRERPDIEQFFNEFVEKHAYMSGRNIATDYMIKIYGRKHVGNTDIHFYTKQFSGLLKKLHGQNQLIKYNRTTYKKI